MADIEILGQSIGKGGLFLIGGPCVIETEDQAIAIASYLKGLCADLGIAYIFKASYDKANRMSLHSYRGPGLVKGLEILATIRKQVGVPVLTDVHGVEEVRLAAESVDMLQIPALLARQTDLLMAAGQTLKPINVKKAQFMTPWDMQHVVEKIYATGNKQIALTERGSQFGYNNLVVDMRSFAIMAGLGHPLVFDATHSVQLPGGSGNCSSGERQYIPNLACAAVAAGADGLFLEVHENPDQALCDGPNSWPLTQTPQLLKKVLAIYQVTRLGSDGKCE